MTAPGADGPNVAGLVYVAASGLDEGESIGALLARAASDPRAGARGVPCEFNPDVTRCRPA